MLRPEKAADLAMTKSEKGLKLQRYTEQLSPGKRFCLIPLSLFVYLSLQPTWRHSPGRKKHPPTAGCDKRVSFGVF